jgi:hypothetical protein
LVEAAHAPTRGVQRNGDDGVGTGEDAGASFSHERGERPRD